MEGVQGRSARKGRKKKGMEGGRGKKRRLILRFSCSFLPDRVLNLPPLLKKKKKGRKERSHIYNGYIYIYICVTAISQRTYVSVRVYRVCNGRGRWSKPTVIFWCGKSVLEKESPFSSVERKEKEALIFHFRNRFYISKLYFDFILNYFRFMTNHSGFEM
jgi:hypothetical protein